jgi:putative heme-binding domain-containing protein
VQPSIFKFLAAFPFAELRGGQVLRKLRVMIVSWACHGIPSGAVVAELDPLYPAATEEVNRELCQLLLALNAPAAVSRTVALMRTVATQEGMMEPSEVVSEQYRMTVFTMKDGSVIAGRISQENDDTVVVMTNPFDPSATTTLHKPDLAARERSKVSLMPPGLLNTLNEEEILDLMAYLESMGDPNHPNFSQ